MGKGRLLDQGGTPAVAPSALDLHAADTTKHGAAGAHAATHQPGGTDPVPVDAAANVGALRTLGTGALQAASGADARLADQRTPLDGSVATAKLANGAVTAAKVASDVATQAELDNHALTPHTGAPSATVVVAANDAPQRWKDVADYQCDGVDDHVQILAAIDTGASEVSLSPGTFGGNRLSKQGRSDLWIHGAAQGATIYQAVDTLTTGAFMAMPCAWEFYGSKVQIGGANPLSANVAKGATTLSTAVDLTASLAPGDLCLLANSEAFSPDRPTEHLKGEFFIVDENDVVAASTPAVTATTVRLTHETYDSYLTANAITLWRYTPIRNVWITDMTFIGGPTQQANGVVIQYGVGVGYKRVSTRGKYVYQGINVAECRNALVEDAYCEGVSDLGSTAGLTGYGVKVTSCEDGSLVRVTGKLCRHLIDIGGHGTRPVSRHWVMDSCIAERCWAAGLATHGGAEFITVRDCTVKNSGGGLILRSGRNRVYGLHVYGGHAEKGYYASSEATSACIWIGEQPTFDGRAGTDLVVRDCLFDMTPTQQAQSVWGIYAEDPLVNATIDSVKFLGLTWHPLHFRGNVNERVNISNCLFDMSKAFSTAHVMLLQPGTVADGNRPVDIVFEHNTIYGGVRLDALVIHGNNVTTTANRGNNIRVEGNTMRGPFGSGGSATTPLLRLADGTFFRFVEVRSNVAPDTTIASLVNQGTATVTKLSKFQNIGSTDTYDATAPV